MLFDGSYALKRILLSFPPKKNLRSIIDIESIVDLPKVFFWFLEPCRKITWAVTGQHQWFWDEKNQSNNTGRSAIRSGPSHLTIVKGSLLLGRSIRPSTPKLVIQIRVLWMACNGFHYEKGHFFDVVNFISREMDDWLRDIYITSDLHLPMLCMPTLI